MGASQCGVVLSDHEVCANVSTSSENVVHVTIACQLRQPTRAHRAEMGRCTSAIMLISPHRAVWDVPSVATAVRLDVNQLVPFQLSCALALDLALSCGHDQAWRLQWDWM